MTSPVYQPPTAAKTASKLIAILVDLPWIPILAEAWKGIKHFWRGMSNEGMFEVLELESTLEIHNKTGTKATYRKRKRVKYLQDNIIAYPDYGWHDGKYFLNYKASPGVPVDDYKIGYKHYVLLSLREVKNKGDQDEFNIQWDVEDGFLKPDGYWATDISNRTRDLKVTVIFPRTRPPKRAQLVEPNTRRTRRLNGNAIQTLPDGRVSVSFEKPQPRLYEQYILRWTW